MRPELLVAALLALAAVGCLWLFVEVSVAVRRIRNPHQTTSEILGYRNFTCSDCKRRVMARPGLFGKKGFTR